MSDTKPNRTIHVGLTDHLDPEVRAMLMAMYSRSYGPIADRLPSNDESAQAHKEKLKRYYVDWGHKSVGQLGSIDVFIEGVSQIAAKAIENHPLYNGQESSTRYIDFSTQPFVDGGDSEIRVWQEKYRDFYVRALPQVIEKLKVEFPFADNSGVAGQDLTESEYKKKHTTWENTIKARAFDICRGLLPAGATTNVAFSGTFDTINDHFGEMLHHPLQEMRDIAEAVLTQLGEKYPHAAMTVEKLKARYSYVTDGHFYNEVHDVNPHSFLALHTGHPKTIFEDGEFGPKTPTLKINLINTLTLITSTFETFEQYVRFNYPNVAIDRKKYEKFPDFISKQFSTSYVDMIDFGSYRDLHRHRNGKINMPVLTPTFGYHSYYIENLPDSLQHELKVLNDAYISWYAGALHLDLQKSRYNLQYSVPMGFQLPFMYICDLNQLLYIFELRSQKTVHQTLRQVVHRWARQFWTFLPCVQLHVDWDEDNFSLKRGTQTITRESENE